VSSAIPSCDPTHANPHEATIVTNTPSHGNRRSAQPDMTLDAPSATSTVIKTMNSAGSPMDGSSVTLACVDQLFVTRRDAQNIGRADLVERDTGGHDDLILLFRKARRFRGPHG